MICPSHISGKPDQGFNDSSLGAQLLRSDIIMPQVLDMFSQRLFVFEGDVDQYCGFLERMLLMRLGPPLQFLSDLTATPGKQIRLAQDGSISAIETNRPPQASYHRTERSLITTNEPDAGDKVPLEFIFYDPTISPGPPKPARDDGRWRAQLNRFLSDIPNADSWSTSGAITFEEVNRLLLHNEVLFDDEGGEQDGKARVVAAPTFNHSCEKEIYDYAAYTSRAIRKNATIRHVLLFRALIVSLTCVVLLEAGIEPNSVNSIQRACICDDGAELTDITLVEYRRGGSWAFKCMLELMAQGWGDRAAELFYRYGQTPAQYKTICANNKSVEAFIMGVKAKGKPVPLGDDQMCISIPCLVKRQVGKLVSLEDICKRFSHNYNDTLRTYERFYAPRSDKETAYRNPHRANGPGDYVPSPEGVNSTGDGGGPSYEIPSAGYASSGANTPAEDPPLPSQGETTARSSINDSPGSTAEAQCSPSSSSGGYESDPSGYGPHPEVGSRGRSEAAFPTPSPEMNPNTYNPRGLEALAEAAETRAKETNKQKRPYPAGNSSQRRVSQRRRSSEETEGDEFSASGTPTYPPMEESSATETGRHECPDPLGHRVDGQMERDDTLAASGVNATVTCAGRETNRALDPSIVNPQELNASESEANSARAREVALFAEQNTIQNDPENSDTGILMPNLMKDTDISLKPLTLSGKFETDVSTAPSIFIQGILGPSDIFD
ncbi:uncharacterized protein GIQ15_04333 [Arthroderma uncinatum]|uniref:uncharacterized protein n=1 Tax=Arthroderma uncinatum TaxID=74035 RepID=UPI00144AC2DD|nr:uncharacterized protein GIQ15_04333 [Arthroderma uncinatum]KAF3481574.1 hypothetical protein GIQ15_04333 [Arthroderma uncinatum]